jgi:hypothetical protein
MNDAQAIEDNRPQITLFDTRLGADYTPTSGNTCRRCKHTHVLTSPVLVTYPGTWCAFECCEECKQQISIALDKAMKELELGE